MKICQLREIKWSVEYCKIPHKFFSVTVTLETKEFSCSIGV